MTIHWIPGHCDIHGNEHVDQMAKQATENQTVDLTVPDTDQNNRRRIKQRYKMEATDAIEEYIEAHDLPPLVQDKNSKSAYALKIITWFRTSCVPVKEVLSRFSPRSNPSATCPFCDTNQDETICHYLFECPKWKSHREKTIIPLLRHCNTLDLHQMLNNEARREALVDFVRSTNRFK